MSGSNVFIYIYRATSAKSLESQDEILRHVQRILQHQQNDKLLETRIEQIMRAQEGLGSTVVELFGLLTSSDNAASLVKGSLIDDLVQALDGLRSANGPGQLEMSPQRRQALADRFIARLKYEGMFDREVIIEPAHLRTFQWVFESPAGYSRPWHDFREWLQSEDQLYWITGKAGSGKSTLMKFISMESTASDTNHGFAHDAAGSQRRCLPYLREWAKDQPLVIATFYFWAGSKNATKIQTSTVGLYRTLLVQILQSCPDAIPYVAPEQWERLSLFNDDSRAFRPVDLRNMLDRAVEYCARRAKLCLFIDGLDEFDGRTEDLQELVAWVTALIARAPIKVCISSRPWRVFEDALEDKPNLLLEDLTYDDIKNYVECTLQEDPHFAALYEREPQFALQLIEEVVQKASGVFLWVHLVCLSLVTGMMEGDRISDLMKRLSEIPAELEDLFERIIDKLESRYRNHAAQYLFLMLACSRTPKAILFSLADEVDENQNYSITLADAPLSARHIEMRVSEMRKRLNSRCKGLIYVARHRTQTQADPSSTTIEYLHRSVKEFADQPSTQEKLYAMLEAPFDPYARLCNASLGVWKSRPLVNRRQANPSSVDLHSQRSGYYCDLLDMFLYAGHAYSGSAHQVNCAIEQAQRSVTQDPEAYVHIPEVLFSLYKDTFPEKMACFGNNILSLTIKFNVHEYIEQELPQHGLVGAKNVRAPSSILIHTQNLTTNKPAKRDAWKSLLSNVMGGGKKTNAAAGEVTELQEARPLRPWPLLLDALFSNPQPNPIITLRLLRSGADPNYIVASSNLEKNCFSVTIFMFTLARAIECVATHKPLKGWDDVLKLMVRYGASIETKTINRAMRLADADGLKPEEHRISTPALQGMLREMKFGTTGANATLANVKSMGQVTVKRNDVYTKRR